MFESTSDMVMCIITIVLCIVGFIAYHDLKIIFKVNAIFEGIEKLYYVEYDRYNDKKRGYRDTKDEIKKDVYSKYLIFGKLIKRPKVIYSNKDEQQRLKIFYKQCEENNAYPYCLIKEMVLKGDCRCSYGYELLDYCERMMIEQDNHERIYIRNCLNLFIIDHKEYLFESKDATIVRDLLWELSVIDYAYYNGDDEFYIDRIIDYIVSARENIKNNRFNRHNDLIDKIFDLFIECIKSNSENYMLQRKKYPVLYLPLSKNKKED